MHSEHKVNNSVDYLANPSHKLFISQVYVSCVSNTHNNSEYLFTSISLHLTIIIMYCINIYQS